MRITRKLLVPTLIFFGLIIIGLITYNTVTSAQQFDDAEQERLENMSEVFRARLKSKQDLAVALASEVANNPEVQAAFAAKDRERLIELTLPSYQVLDAQFDVPQYQFHLPPATSFLRLHSLDKYGDDLSSFRFTVLAANAEKRTVSGPELGRGGLGVRGVVPVTYQGRHIGTVEFGTDIGSTLIEELKSDFGYDLQILLSRGPAEVATFEGATGESQGPIDELLFQAGTLTAPVYASATNYQRALAGEVSIDHFSLNDLEYAVYSTPLYDYSGDVIGVVDIVSDHTAIAQQQNAQMILSVGVLLAILLVSGFTFAFFTGRTLRPIGELTSAATSIAAGDFNKRTNVKSDDELGTLAQAFDSMTRQLQELFGTLEQRVADRTKALATSTEVSRRLSTILDQGQLVKEVVEQVQSAFHYYHAHIYLLNAAGDELVMAGGTGEAGQTMLARGHKISRGKGLVGGAADTNTYVLVPDTSSNPDWLPNPLLPNTKSEIAVPISIGGQVLGVLDVQHNVAGGLNQDDADLLQSIANQVAVALQNIKQYENTQKIAADMGVVANVGITTSTITEPGHLLQEVVDLSKKSFNLYHAHIYLLDEAGNSLELVSGSGEVGKLLVSEKRSIPLDSEQSLVARAARTGEGVVVNDVTTAPDFLPNPLLPLTRSEMAVPMIAAGKVIGVLDVQSDTVNRFTDVDVSIQTTLASQVAIALQNARSYAQLQRQAERETTLNAISQKIQGATTIEAALQTAARELGHALGMRQTLVALDPSALSASRTDDDRLSQN